MRPVFRLNSPVDFFLRSPGQPATLGVLPGSFNPLTIAHIGLADAAAGLVDEVLFVLPRSLPHKEYSGASFSERIDMLLAALRGRPACSIAASTGGLFAEIAGECRTAYGERVRLSFLCGRDAAERIAGWDYGREGEFARMLQSFDLLVATRGGAYHPPSGLGAAIRPLPFSPAFEPVSSSDIRARIHRGEPWEHLVPPAIHNQVRKIYLP